MEKVTKTVIQKLKKGDELSFFTVFYTYRDKIYYLALKMTRNKNDAEDCVQEIFLKLLNNIDKFDSKKASFGTWLITIAKNHIIDYMKLKKIHEDKVFLNPLLVDSTCIESKADEKVLLTEIEQIVGEENYQILILKKGFKMTFDQIATLLEMSPSKVKRMFYDAYRKAKNYVMERENENESAC